jgi:hypothetical protein
MQVVAIGWQIYDLTGSALDLGLVDEMRGRVSAVNSLFIGTSNTLGEFESGVTAAWFGVMPAVLIGGIGTVLVALIGMRLFPELLRIESLEREQPQSATK